jgi:hypothetical protein
MGYDPEENILKNKSESKNEEYPDYSTVLLRGIFAK